MRRKGIAKSSRPGYREECKKSDRHYGVLFILTPPLTVTANAKYSKIPSSSRKICFIRNSAKIFEILGSIQSIEALALHANQMRMLFHIRIYLDRSLDKFEFWTKPAAKSLNGQSLIDVTSDTLRDYIKTMKEQGLKGSTIRTAFAAIIAFYDYLQYKELIEASPTSKYGKDTCGNINKKKAKGDRRSL